mgnify:CR=1 FL=1
MTERTLVLVKPDGVARGLTGQILDRIERKGYRLVALELRTLDVATAQAHYGEHADKPFFGELVSFITSAPLVAAVIEGPEAITAWRTLMGVTDPIKSAPGTIRGDLASVALDLDLAVEHDEGLTAGLALIDDQRAGGHADLVTRPRHLLEFLVVARAEE